VPDVQALHDLREEISFVDESVLLRNTERAVFNTWVEEGGHPLKVTLTYADPAANPAASIHRINDLTVKVTSPSGTVYWGNHGLLQGNWSRPDGEPDTIDTVENVFVESPESGLWLVEVIASELIEDGHVETPELDADFALVVSGGSIESCRDDGVVSLDRPAYTCQDRVRVRVVDCGPNLDRQAVDAITVTVDSDSEPEGELLELTETGPDTATFSGTLPLDESDGPGTLLVADQDTVTAVYVDADDGQGGSDVPKTDSAPIDCTAPEISGVQTTEVGGHFATVSFDTNETARGTVRYGDQVIRGSRGTETGGAIASSAEVAQAEALRARIGLLGHAALLYPDLTPRENLGLFAELYRMDAPTQAVDEALDRFDLGGFADRPARTLSRGQLQRAALARALVHRPDLLLLDEPSTGLDPRSNDRLVAEVEVERARGAVIVLVTHDPALAERVATRRLRMHRGRLLAAAEAPG
ncbi:MAG TPA: ABC transporter ATP-binding protein, partial [Polyangiaceae bacterium LLY-WYZ-14_1]|nr:ABC transporter ATP-binding protein [Polyangiaceae bacterium LLY-WYZ-14_1]